MVQEGIFDRGQYRLHRDRSSVYKSHNLYQYVSRDLAERLYVCNFSKQNRILEIGARDSELKKFFENKGYHNQIINADISYGVLDQKFDKNDIKIQCDEEKLPFADESFDIIIGNLNMHWVNNLPLALSNFYRVLKKNGIFLIAIIGGSSLKELRSSFVEVESKYNDIKYHISPMIKSESLSMLLQKIGFKEIIIDSYDLRLEYSNFDLMLKSFQNMGESNCLQGKVSYLKKEILGKVRDNYYKKCGLDNGYVYCNIEIINAIGYK